MSTIFSRALMIMRSLSLKTHAFSLCVIAGTILLSASMFFEPNTEGPKRAKSVIVREMVSNGASNLEINVSVETIFSNDDESVNKYPVYNTGDFVVDASDSVDVFARDEICKEEYDTFCKLVEAEAASEDLKGKELVASVILNRIKSNKFENDVLSVIYEDGQFVPAEKGVLQREFDISHDTKQAVINIICGGDSSDGALYFQKSASREWGDKTYLYRHGAHSFYQ